MAVKDLVPTFGKRRLPIQKFDDDSPFQLMRREMNRLFDNFFHDFRLTPFGEDLAWNYPRVDIKENDKEVIIEAELPGMDEKDIDISLSDNVLSISGEKKQEKEEKKGKYYHVERSYGSFHREILLHCEVEQNKAQASFKKGVLKITLPKTPKAQQKAKSIPIRID